MAGPLILNASHSRRQMAHMKVGLRIRRNLSSRSRDPHSPPLPQETEHGALVLSRPRLFCTEWYIPQPPPG